MNKNTQARLMLVTSGMGFMLTAAMVAAYVGQKAGIPIIIGASVIYFVVVFLRLRKLRGK